MIMVRGGYKKPEGALVLIRLADSLLLNDVTQVSYLNKNQKRFQITLVHILM